MDKPIITPSIKLEFNELHLKQLIEDYTRRNNLTPEDGKIEVTLKVSRGYEAHMGMGSTADTVKVIATWKPENK